MFRRTSSAPNSSAAAPYSGRVPELEPQKTQIRFMLAFYEVLVVQPEENTTDGINQKVTAHGFANWRGARNTDSGGGRCVTRCLAPSFVQLTRAAACLA